MPPLVILYEDNHCLAVDKPAGLLTQGDATGDLCLLDQVRDDLKIRYQKPGNVFVGLLHRLDRPVSGVVLFAKTSKAAARLSAQFRDSTIEKFYLAFVEGEMTGQGTTGLWRDWLRKDPRGTRSASSLANRPEDHWRKLSLKCSRSRPAGRL